MAGIDAAIIGPSPLFQASGHIGMNTPFSAVAAIIAVVVVVEVVAADVVSHRSSDSVFALCLLSRAHV